MSSACEWVHIPSRRQVAGRVREAQGFGQRARGLLGRAGLEPGEGLWLRPCRQVHTMFMRFAIDAVFLDRDLVVVGVCSPLLPWRLSPLFWRARSCLELAAGAAAWLRPGDALEMTPAAMRAA